MDFRGADLLQSTSSLQQRRKLGLASLEIGVATDVLLVDVDVWDGGLAVHLS